MNVRTMKQHMGIVGLAALMVIAGVSFAAEKLSSSKPNVYLWKTYPWDELCPDIPIWKALEEAGFNVVTGHQIELKTENLKPFQAIIITDLFADPNLTNTKLPEEKARYAKLLNEYVEAGGSLWVFGRSMNHMSHQTATDALNDILRPWGAEVLQEVIRDSDHEQTQERFTRQRYACTKNIVKDPLTKGVGCIWYPNMIMVGVTAPLKLSPEWKPLVRAAKGSVTHPLGLDGNAYPRELEDKTGTAGDQPVMAAVRGIGKGHVLLTGFTSTIPFWGYKHLVWEDIATTEGLDGRRSDWLAFFMTSLKGLALEATTSGELTVKPINRQEPQPLVVQDWDKVNIGVPNQKLFKGIIGASTAYSDGKGTVAEFVKTARDMGADFVVFSENLKELTGDNFKKLMEECKAASSADFAAIPAIKYLDVDGNHRILLGEKCWPSAKRLFPQDRTIFGPVWLWFDAGTPMHIAYDFSHSNWPAYANLGLNAMGVRTYEEGQLIDEALSCYLDNQHRGDCLTPVVVNICRSPEAIKKVTEWYMVPAESVQKFAGLAMDRYAGWGDGWQVGFITTGPKIRQWAGYNLGRFTAGRYYLPGTERWRVCLKVESEAPLKTVEIMADGETIRVYRPEGNSFDLILDEVHDRRKVLIARVTDTQGRQALTGGLTVTDNLYDQGQCSDRQNFMGGCQDSRDEKDRYVRMQSTAMLGKATRPLVGNVQTSDPALLNPWGVDGGFGNTFCMFTPFQVRGKTWDVFHFPVFRNGFRYCSRDAIIFDQEITHRIGSDCGAWPSIESGEPWQTMEPARYVKSRSVWYNFPRRFNDWSPSLADFEMTFTRAVTLSKVCDPDQGRALFWTHRLGFHHPEFRFKGPKGLVEWKEPPSNVYQDNLPSILLGAAEGEPSPGSQDLCSIVTAGGKVTTINAGKDAVNPNAWQGWMKSGDYMVLYPNLGGAGGFVLLDGDLQSRVELGYDWLRVYNGLYEQRTFNPGDRYEVRLLTLQGKLKETDVLQEWNGFRDAWGLTGKAPAYTLDVKKGKLLGTKYLLEIEAQDGAVMATIGQADLGQRLPVRINGLSTRTTAAIVNNTRKEWLPIGVTAIEAYATLDTRPGPSDVFIGNIVKADSAELWCTVLPEKEGFVMDVHNPTEKPITATITVPDGLWMIKGGGKPVEVKSGQTVRVQWK